jgi:hypothetical protein
LKSAVQIQPGAETDTANASLLLVAGLSYYSYGILNHLTKELVDFGYYTADRNTNDFFSFLDEQAIFKNRYHQYAVAYDTPEVVLVPGSIFHSDAIHVYLQATAGQAVQSTLVSEELAGWQMQSVYRLPSVLQAAINRKCVNSQSWHIHSVMLKNYQATDINAMIIDFKTEDFNVLVFSNHQLLLAQTFNYTTPDDVLYSLLKCCHQLNISQQQVTLTLSGLIEKDSAVYRELYKYFIHLSFDGLYGGMQLAEPLQSHPVHYYSTISKLAACV